MMRRVPLFFSCSFRKDDEEINLLVASLCQAMDIETINVSGAFARTPPDQARTQILQSAGVLALAVRRDKQDDGSWAMPAAVREEIAIAFALHKPVLLLFEDGVRIDGFMNNYGTDRKSVV